MAFFDLPLDELRTYTPEVRRPADLDAFWGRTLAEAAAHPIDVTLTPVDTGFVLVDTFDVEFSGFAGDRIRGLGSADGVATLLEFDQVAVTLEAALVQPTQTV